VSLDRRRFLAVGASTVLASGTAARAETRGPEAVQAAVARFAKLPVTSSCLVAAEHPTAPWQVAHDPKARLFVGSAVKTFILAQVLREVEAGRLSENDQVAIDDKVRSLSSPVFLNLSGTTTRRSVLEAMIAHSDNTATDVALESVGPTSVRALIKDAGLAQSQIPESTRRLFSYVAGAPEGTDLGWAGIQQAVAGKLPGKPRPSLNDRETMASTADDLVRWYQQALRGTFFKKPETLVEFKRIQAMADALSMIVPADIAAYGKGGSIDWADFHCLSVAGQMIVGKVPVTFCFTINWTGPDDGVPAMMKSYGTAVADIMQQAAVAAR
jgi:beta-lactamase class A